MDDVSQIIWLICLNIVVQGGMWALLLRRVQLPPSQVGAICISFSFFHVFSKCHMHFFYLCILRVPYAFFFCFSARTTRLIACRVTKCSMCQEWWNILLGWIKKITSPILNSGRSMHVVIPNYWIGEMIF